MTGCPLTAALAAIGGKWKMIILYWLAEEPAHFAALRRKMPGISQKVLTQQLRELQADGLVHRQAAERLAQPVVYSLTPYGRSLMPLIESVRRWGRTHLGRGQRHRGNTEEHRTNTEEHRRTQKEHRKPL